MGRGRGVLVLTHVPWEEPGLATHALAGVPVRTRTVVADVAPDLPAARDLAGLVVMGGPQRADDDARFPGLPAERRLLADAVETDVPVLGVCLGMQLLAVALGARLHAAVADEVGFAPVDVLAADPVLAPLGPRPEVLHWHSDAVELPAGARALASSPATPVQAFRAGSGIGMQFHVEVDRPLLSRWLRTPDMTAGIPPTTAQELRTDAARVLPALERAAARGLAAFAADIRERT